MGVTEILVPSNMAWKGKSPADLKKVNRNGKCKGANLDSLIIIILNY
jgi:hypothetical protein